MLSEMLPAWRVKSIIRNLLLYAVAYGLTILFALPFLWAISSSLKPVNELFLWPPQLIPKTWRWENYVEIWHVAPLARFFVNTVYVTVFFGFGSYSVRGIGRLRLRALPLSLPQLPLHSAAEYADAALPGHDHSDVFAV